MKNLVTMKQNPQASRYDEVNRNEDTKTSAKDNKKKISVFINPNNAKNFPPDFFNEKGFSTERNIKCKSKSKSKLIQKFQIPEIFLRENNNNISKSNEINDQDNSIDKFDQGIL